MPVVVPTNVKKRIIAGINWSKIIMAPMIINIQRATPASLRLIDLAKAGLDIKIINANVIRENR
jgi:hypothetical protein